MKNKILTNLIVGFAIVSLSSLVSCKKGDNDPFLSVKSRKARIAGEWVLTEGMTNSSYSFSGSSGTSTTTYNGGTQTNDGSTTGYSETLSIEKDGTYEVLIIDDGVTYSAKGIWFFSGKIKDQDLKNKEAVVFQETQTTAVDYSTTFQGLYGGEVMIIDQLKNKEMIFKGSSSNSSSGFTSNSSYELTFEKK